jgi:DNA repair protein RecN (Recombination protein N)
MDRSNAELQEVISGVQSMSADLEEGEYVLADIDDRLFSLRALARKHGCTVDELQKVRHDLANQLNLIEMQGDVLSDLTKNLEKARSAYIEKAQSISEARQGAAQKLDKLVSKELPPLKLEKAGFCTQVSEKAENLWNEAGIDDVKFLVSTNPGSAPGPLNKIASGGEMSRFMLALKVVMAEVGHAPTLIFDEVDSGIGGATASAVGERLARLSLSKQILVVTHSPQVAARASHHWIVLKGGDKEVLTRVIPLDEVHDRREEIARMLAGNEVTVEARAAAGKLLENRA